MIFSTSNLSHTSNLSSIGIECQSPVNHASKTQVRRAIEGAMHRRSLLETDSGGCASSQDGDRVCGLLSGTGDERRQAHEQEATLSVIRPACPTRCTIQCVSRRQPAQRAKEGSPGREPGVRLARKSLPFCRRLARSRLRRSAQKRILSPAEARFGASRLGHG